MLTNKKYYYITISSFNKKSPERDRFEQLVLKRLKKTKPFRVAISDPTKNEKNLMYAYRTRTICAEYFNRKKEVKINEIVKSLDDYRNELIDELSL